jgi:hypothetical protein
MGVCDQFVGRVVGQGKMKVDDIGGKRKSGLCVLKMWLSCPLL